MTTTTATATLTGLAELEAAHRAVWTAGSYADVAQRLVRGAAGASPSDGGAADQSASTSSSRRTGRSRCSVR